MAKKQQTEISVVTIFDGKQDERQAFIDLILNKRKTDLVHKKCVEYPRQKVYNESKVFSDVHVG